MRLLYVRFEGIYSWSGDSDENKEKYRSRIEARRGRIKSVGVELPDGAEMESPEICITDDQFVKLAMLGEVMSIKGSNEPKFDTFDRTVERLEVVVGKLEQFGSSAGPGQFNEKVEVYTPGMGLMLFNNVMLLEDACSDALQTHIDEGWRIIAACPQPNQRRPDYILGRYDPTRDASVHGKGASRG